MKGTHWVDVALGKAPCTRPKRCRRIPAAPKAIRPRRGALLRGTSDARLELEWQILAHLLLQRNAAARLLDRRDRERRRIGRHRRLSAAPSPSLPSSGFFGGVVVHNPRRLIVRHGTACAEQVRAAQAKSDGWYANQAHCALRSSRGPSLPSQASTNSSASHPLLLGATARVAQRRRLVGYTQRRRLPWRESRINANEYRNPQMHAAKSHREQRHRSLKADLFLIGFCVFYLASNFSSSLCPSYSISASTAR